MFVVEAENASKTGEVSASDTKATMRKKYNAKLEQYAKHIGLLKAEIARINAVGHKVATMANVQAEFDFNNAPAQGGPIKPLGRLISASGTINSSELDQSIKRISKVLIDRGHKLSALEAVLSHADLQQQVQPEGKPVRKGYVSSPFGVRYHPITRRRRHHDGMDFAAPRNTPIYSVAAGVITYSGRRGGYGNLVEITHGGGLITRYAHNSRNLVSLGVKVGKHQKIALVGSTGHSTGNHVHFEVIRNGKTVNPIEYIRSTYKNQNPLFNKFAKQVISKKPVTKTPLVIKNPIEKRPAAKRPIAKRVVPVTPKKIQKKLTPITEKQPKAPETKAGPVHMPFAPNEIKAE